MARRHDAQNLCAPGTVREPCPPHARLTFMNNPQPPPLPGSGIPQSASLDPAFADHPATVYSEGQVAVAAGGVLAVTSLADFLCWKAWPGIGWGIFAASLGVLLLATGVRSRAGWLALLLLVASCAQLVVEPCFTGFASIGTLLIVIFAESTYSALPRGWARWSEALFALLRGPGRWWSFSWAVTQSRTFVAGANCVDCNRIGLLTRIVMPALILAAVFGIVLSHGNAILSELFSRSAVQAWQWVLHFDWTYGHMAFWFVCATLGVALCWPPAAPVKARFWTRPIRSWVRPQRMVAIWQSALVLIALNALFFAANTIDAIYLWDSVALPKSMGMTPSRFVHEGVHSLIGAVVLAALVLTILFQQDATIVGSRFLKGLALAWIAQNLLLIGSVFLRLKLYIETFQLSELRVYVGCFLLLVATGFVLLAWRVVRGMNLGRLLLANAQATFVLFFVLQFADVGRFVANFNVTQWHRNPEARTLDLEYLEELGPSGWGALLKVRQFGLETAETPLADSLISASAQADRVLRKIATSTGFRLARQDWREWQVRRDRAAAWLVKEVRTWPTPQGQ